MNQTNILLVEDNEGDAVLTLKALQKARIKNHVDIVDDGEKALDYLYKKGEYATAKTPDLILLDINLPKLNGKEVLQKIKQDEKLKIIPVIILTTSDREKDIVESYQNHANCYITKPVDFSKFMNVVVSIENFWLMIVTLP